MNSVQLKPEQEQLLKNIAKQSGFETYQLILTAGSSKGDNYLGEILSVTIEEGEKKLGLILKTGLVGEFRNNMPIRQAYLREIFVYEILFPTFEEFQKKYGLTDPFQAYAKIYGTTNTENSECLVLENLRLGDYSMWDRKMPMNPEHMSVVIKEYAKFHAVSLAMRAKEPEVYDELTKKMGKHVFEEYMKEGEKFANFIKAVMTNVYEVFEDDSVTTEILKRFEERLPVILAWMVEQLEEVVIGHGDSWCNNFMFSYKDEKHTSPSEVRIIDWQVAGEASPAMDLAYFFLVSSSRETLYNYEVFLRLYHDTLCRNLREFSCDPDTVFPYSTLLRHWKERVEFGIFMSFNLLKLMSCNSDEAPDMSKIDESGSNVTEIINFTSKENELFNRRIKDLVEFSIEKGFLSI